MNTPGNQSEDDVTAAYRRTSDAEAGQPSPVTRATILAEARAASLRRTPAANDSRYVWRAAAGLAVIGVAVLLWRQVDRHVSTDLTVASNDRSDAAAEAPAPQVGADTSVAAAESAAKVESEEARTGPAQREFESPRAEKAAGADLASVAAPAAPSLERASADAAPALAAGALRQGASDYQELMSREFPEIWKGDRVASIVWVVMDAGKVARKGVLAGADTLATIESGSPGTWTMVEVKTASGSSLQLAVRNID